MQSQDNRLLRPVAGRYRVIGVYKANGFILETADGAVSARKSAACDWYAEQAVMQQGAAEEITIVTLNAKHTTPDALLAALQPAVRVGRVYLSGHFTARGVKIAEPTVHVTGDVVELNHADPGVIQPWPKVSLRNAVLQVQVHHTLLARMPVLSLSEVDTGVPQLLVKNMP